MIAIEWVAGLSTVQDGGRPGHMHEGVPPGGALVPELLARANAGVHNSFGDAAIEVFGALTIAARAELLVADEESRVSRLRAAETLTVACGRERVRYLAVRGGIDVPRLLGGRGTLLVASLGGHEGRGLRKGDVLQVGRSSPCEDVAPPAPERGTAIRVVKGPDLHRFDASALDLLLTSEFEVSTRSDRVGTRLVGPPLPRTDDDTGFSAPMVRGAIQVPLSGEAIVLGPDHPTTGGYPVLATVVRADFGALMARRAADRVRFALARQ